MAEVRHGTVVVTIDDSLEPPERAGNLSPTEVRRLPKARRGIGLVGMHTADAMGKAGARFLAPPGVSPEALVAACQRADGIDQVIVDMEVILQRLKQANLLFDAEAWEMLRKVNDQVKAQSKHEPELAAMFTVLRDFMKLGPRPSSDPTEEG